MTGDRREAGEVLPKKTLLSLKSISKFLETNSKVSFKIIIKKTFAKARLDLLGVDFDLKRGNTVRNVKP